MTRTTNLFIYFSRNLGSNSSNGHPLFILLSTHPWRHPCLHCPYLRRAYRSDAGSDGEATSETERHTEREEGGENLQSRPLTMWMCISVLVYGVEWCMARRSLLAFSRTGRVRREECRLASPAASPSSWLVRCRLSLSPCPLPCPLRLRSYMRLTPPFMPTRVYGCVCAVLFACEYVMCYLSVAAWASVCRCLSVFVYPSVCLSMFVGAICDEQYLPSHTHWHPGNCGVNGGHMTSSGI